MHVDRSGGRSTGRRLSRRSVLSGLLAGLPPLSSPHVTAQMARDIPSFASGSHRFVLVEPRTEIPSVRLFRMEGGTIDLAALRGKPVVLNFWASWCPGCREELPILERQYRGAWWGKLHLAAVSEDRASRSTVEQFVRTLGLKDLPIYLDPNGYVAYSDRLNRNAAPFALYGMPITYLISGSGWVVGYMPGVADWSSAAATALIEHIRTI